MWLYSAACSDEHATNLYTFRSLTFRCLLFWTLLQRDVESDFAEFLVYISCLTVLFLCHADVQTDALNAISDLITVEYTCLTFVQITLHVKTSRWLNASILMTWFTSICWRCALHCSFMFSWIFKTRTSDFNLIIEFFICILVIMLNFLDFLVKCVNSYFSDANVASWIQAYFMQTSCALLNVLQISSMNLSYARMLMSFTKLSTLILILNALHFSIKLMLKNRKRIDEMKDS
jgi:hypothetical protein